MSNYIDKAWAENGDKTDVPVNAQVDGSVSYDQGFTDLYDRDVVTDPTALSLSRTNFNGDKNKITANLKQWLDQCYPDYYQLDNLGNPVEYKIYSAVRYNDGVYLSKINNNTSLPTNTTNWSLFQTLDFASEAEAIARTAIDKWMNPFVTGKLIDNELIGQTPSNGVLLGNVNLDTFTTVASCGFYYQNSSVFGTVANSYPVNNGNWIIQVYSRGGGNRLSMIAINMTSNQLYMRSNLGAWGVWTQIGGKTTDTLNPVGSLMQFPANNIPAGYLVTDFSAVSRVGFSALFAVIGTTFGAGDGSTTFNLPPFDNDGAFLRGSGGNAAALGVLQGDAIRNITGNWQNADPNATIGFYSGIGLTGAFKFDGSLQNRRVAEKGSNSYSSYPSIQIDASLQVPTAPENRVINYAIKICIKT